MDQWIVEVKNHPIMQTLNVVIARTDEVTKNIDKIALETIYRIKTVAEYVKALIENSKTELLAKSALNEAKDQLANIPADISTFITSKNFNNFSNAVNLRLDATLRIIGALPFAKKVNFPKQLSETTESYLKNVYKRFDDIDKKGQEFNVQVTSLNGQLQGFSQKISQQQEVINNEKARLDKIIPDFQNNVMEVRKDIETQAKNQRDTIQSAFEEIESNFDKENQQLFDKAKKDFEQLSSNFEETAKKTLADIQSKKEEAAKLLGLASNIVLAGNYKTTASQEKLEADELRKRALFAFASAALIGVIFFIASIIYPITIESLAIRISVILLVAGIGLYCAHESSQHRTEERNNKRMELELTSIDPYLEKISDEKRDEVKVKLASRFFANPAIKNNKVNKYYPFIIKKLFRLLDDSIKKDKEG